MTQPAVNIFELDGALGILPPSSGKLLAVIGVASKGPFATPATYGRVTDLVNDFGTGPGVEAAARHIQLTGRPVVFVRTAQTTAGTGGTVDSTGKTGTSAVTINTTSKQPIDDYELVVKVLLGGTIGTGPITIQISLDNGRTWNPAVSLGTANSYEVLTALGTADATTTGIVLAFGAGTLVTNDVIKTRTTAPQWNSSDLSAALTALGNSAVTWEFGHIVGGVTSTDVDTIETAFTGFRAKGKRREWFANFRMPNVGETEAAYLTAWTTAFSAKATLQGSVGYGSCGVVSSVSGRQHQRPTAFVGASWEQSLQPQENGANPNLGPLPGVTLTDINGNSLFHDESLNPGGDDARGYTLRTIPGLQGVYVNRPLLLSPTGSDYDIIPKRRVMNVAEDALYAYFVRRLNAPIQVDKKTGFILESEAMEIEAGAQAAVRAATSGMVSDVTVTVARNDNLLSTKTLNGEMRIVPLAYPETINLKTGFTNPALNVQAAA